MSQRRLPPPCRYIYVIGPELGLQKIGIATDPRARLATLQTASPLKLKIHASVAVPFGAAHAVERRTHEALRAARANGEWFEIAPAEAATAVRAAAAACSALEGSAGALPLFDFMQAAQAQATGGWRFDVSPPALRASLERIWKVARRLAEGS